MLTQVGVEGGRFSEIAATATATTAIRTELASWPWSTVIIGKIHAAIIPRVAIGVEAATALNGDERRLRNVTGTEFEERIGGRLGAILASVQEGRDRRHATRLAELVEDGAALTSNVISE